MKTIVFAFLLALAAPPTQTDIDKMNVKQLRELVQAQEQRIAELERNNRSLNAQLRAIRSPDVCGRTAEAEEIRQLLAQGKTQRDEALRELPKRIAEKKAFNRRMGPAGPAAYSFHEEDLLKSLRASADKPTWPWITKIEVGEIGQLRACQNIDGTTFHKMGAVEIVSIVDEDEMIVRGFNTIFQICGKQTAGIVDGQTLVFDEVFEVTGTYQYTSMAGVKTVFKLESIDVTTNAAPPLQPTPNRKAQP